LIECRREFAVVAVGNAVTGSRRSIVRHCTVTAMADGGLDLPERVPVRDHELDPLAAIAAGQQ
jgi:hypothetical protein